MKEKKKQNKVLKLSRQKFKKTMLITGWGLLSTSIVFGVYNNFTAVDTHTINETRVIQEKTNDISGVEQFVENFAREYYAFDVSPQAKEYEKTQLEKYFQKDLIQMNYEILNEAKEKTEVKEFKIWAVKNISENKSKGKDYKVTYQVRQHLTKSKKDFYTTYVVHVHKDKDSYVITKNPVVTASPNKSNYEAQKLINNGDMISAKETKKIQSFLDTFFKLYPKATDKEIVYYVKDKDVKPIDKNYTFVKIDNLVINKVKNGYDVHFYCQYKDNDTKMLIMNEYNAELTKQESGELVIKSLE